MNEYTPYNNTLVAIKEPTVTEIVPKSGPYAGKKHLLLSSKRIIQSLKKMNKENSSSKNVRVPRLS